MHMPPGFPQEVYRGPDRAGALEGAWIRDSRRPGGAWIRDSPGPGGGWIRDSPGA